MARVSSGRQQTPSATSMSKQPRASTLHHRNPSVISTSADQELCAVAELMSRVVVERRDSLVEEQELLGVALEDEFEDFIEPSIHHELESAARTKKVNRYADSEPSPYPPSSPSRNSMCSDSELDQTSDSEPAHLAKAAAYPAFHLPRPRRRQVGIRDSDTSLYTPSLSSSTSFSSLGSVSRSQSRRNSPPVSPASLVTPIDHQSAAHAHLAIIEERNVEDQEIPYRLSMESSGNVTAITFAVPQLSSVPSKKTEDIQYDIPTLRQRVPQLDHLRINTMSPPRRSRSQSPSLLSSTVSSDSGHFSPVEPQIDSFTKQRSGSTISFTRFMGGKGKSEKTVAKMDRDVALRSAQSPAASVLSVATTRTKEEIKQRKAEEKQRKKAEAKAKTERLAIELKEKARQRAEAREKAASLHSSRSGDRRPIWAEGPSMYGSLGTL
ncbi:hypothetical protein PILCRDRAFT_212912 [Piloderma croceum F 1598]|uniref:Uncharacterized protein n=1 Tax=Piloderma croceum (strain F 1598) TaxID=765440 RepID=A0A0C3GEQ2_PILCF|nr:hypothetical protein PILCRDRAFT_212912 [Piloderma croceum F 1598]